MALPPGFRFHPTDEELVAYYLRRKVGGRTIAFNIIVEIDLYKQEPWDLPEKSVSYGSDMEWYFFSPRDKKYPNGLRTNRATEAGYWKATGKDRNVKKAGRIIGMKKTLVFYRGRAPHGERTDWVMHEYRLNEEEYEKVHAAQCHHFVSLPNVAKSMNIRHVHHVDASSEEDPPHLHELFVLCRVLKKSGVGPRSGDDRGPQTYVDDDIDREPCGSFAEAVKKALEPGTAATSAIALAPEETPTVTSTAISAPIHFLGDRASSGQAGDAINMSRSAQEQTAEVAPTGSSPISAPSLSVEDYAPSEEAGDTIVTSTSVPFGEYILDEPSFSENDDDVQFWDCFPSITGELDFSTFTDGPLAQLSSELFGAWQGDRDASTSSGMMWSSDLKSDVQPQQQPQQDEANFGVGSSEMLQLELLKTDDVLPPLEEELESDKPRNHSEACGFSPNYCEIENQMLRGRGPARASERVAQQQHRTSEEAQQRACSSNDGLNRCEAAPRQRMSNVNFSGPEVPSEGEEDSASLNVMCPAPRGSPSINFDTNQLPSSSDPTPSASARGIGIAGVPEDSLYSFQDSFLDFPVEDNFNSGPEHDDNGFSFAVQHELVGEQGNSPEPPPPDESVKPSKSAVSEGPPSFYWSTQEGPSEKTRPSGLMKLLGSLSVLPASAAECPPDMMPVQKDVEVGSTYSSIHLSTVTVTCTSSVDGAQKVQAAVIDCRLQGDAQGVYQEVVSASWQTLPVEKAGNKEGSESQKPLCANCDTAAASGVLQRRVARGSNSGFVFVFGLGAVSALCWFLLLGGMWRIASHVFSSVF